MPRGSPMQVAFNAGEWRETLAGRLDRPSYAGACRELVNFIPLVEGPAERRPGTVYGGEPKTPSSRCTLIPFEFNAEQAYVVELGENFARFWTNSGLLLDAFGVPVEVVTPWSAEVAKKLQVRQSADVMFVAGAGVVAPHTISRTSASTFVIAPYAPDWAPFRRENTNESLTVQASAVAIGATVLTATGFTFTQDDPGRLVRLREVIESKHAEWAPGVDPINLDTGAAAVVNDEVHWEGRVYRLTVKVGAQTGTRPPIHESGSESDGRWTWLFLHGGEGYARIDSSTTGLFPVATVNATVIHTLPASVGTAGAATFRFSWGAWDMVSGYPRGIELLEERAWWGGTNADPDTLWATRPGGTFANFRRSNDAEGALQFRMLSGKPNLIETIVGTKTLNIATAGGLFPATGADPKTAISIENLLDLHREVSYGAAKDVGGLAIDNVAIFITRSRRALREVLFDFDQDAFTAPDLGKLAGHLFASGIVGVAYAAEPYRMLFAWMEDGSLAAALYDRPQEALGWFRVVLGGDSPFVESVAVIPHPDGDGDQVWISVRRSFGSGTQRSVEYFAKGFLETTTQVDAFFVDAGLTYAGAPATVISGLTHLEGQSVQILADGARVADRVVSGGQVTLDEAASKVHVGLGYTSRLVPMRFEAGAADGTAQGRTKKLGRAVVRLFLTGEGSFYGDGTPGGPMDPFDLRRAVDLMSTAVPLYTGDTPALDVPGGWGQNGLFAWEHRGPTPCTVVAVMPQLDTSRT